MIGMHNWGHPRVLFHPQQVRQFMKTQARPVPNPFGDRGVVLRPIWRHEGGKFRRPADFVLLRKLLLYWDVVAWPQFTTLELNMDFESTKPYADLDFLGKEGVVQLMPIVSGVFGRPEPQMPLEERAWRFHEQMYLNLEFQEPGQWAMGQSSTVFTSPIPNDVLTADGALGSLTNLLPAPAHGVSYEDILKFRRTNREALVTFRMLLDELSAEVMRNPDKARAYSVAHRRLDEAIKAIWVLAREQRFEARRITFGTALAFGAGAVAGIGLVLAAAPFVGFPLTLAAISGASAAGGGLGGLTYLNEKVANPAERQGTAAYLLRAIDDEVIEEPLR